MDFRAFSKNLIKKAKTVSSELITGSLQVLQERSDDLKKYLMIRKVYLLLVVQEQEKVIFYEN